MISAQIPSRMGFQVFIFGFQFPVLWLDRICVLGDLGQSSIVSHLLGLVGFSVGDSDSLLC